MSRTSSPASVLDNGEVWGARSGVTVAADGSLLVSDDGSNSIWRVSWARTSEHRVRASQDEFAAASSLCNAAKREDTACCRVTSHRGVRKRKFSKIGPVAQRLVQETANLCCRFESCWAHTPSELPGEMPDSNAQNARHRGLSPVWLIVETLSLRLAVSGACRLLLHSGDQEGVIPVVFRMALRFLCVESRACHWSHCLRRIRRTSFTEGDQYRQFASFHHNSRAWARSMRRC